MEDIPHVSKHQEICKLLSPCLTFPAGFIEAPPDDYKRTIKPINLALRVIGKMAKNVIGQNVLLYTDFLKVIIDIH